MCLGIDALMGRALSMRDASFAPRPTVGLHAVVPQLAGQILHLGIKILLLCQEIIGVQRNQLRITDIRSEITLVFQQSGMHEDSQGSVDWAFRHDDDRQASRWLTSVCGVGCKSGQSRC